MELLAILGRGIQRSSKDGPWVLTEDLEVCDDRSAHLPVRVPANDNNPFCMIGGGEMNLEAGHLLMQNHQPEIVVCAYGDRSGYLKSVNGPTESEVMSAALQHDVMVNNDFSSWHSSLPNVIVWPATRPFAGASNTNRELENIFELAIERGQRSIGVVTVSVHLPRALLQAQRHLAKPEFASLADGVQFYASEEVLRAADSDRYGPRIDRIFASQAYQRNWLRELDGIRKILAGAYKDDKPAVVAMPTATVAVP